MTGFEQDEEIPLQDLKTGPSFVVDFGANMNEIVELHEMDMDVSTANNFRLKHMLKHIQVVVQPGMPYEMLNEELKSKGLFFPVDVSKCSPYLESTHY